MRSQETLQAVPVLSKIPLLHMPLDCVSFRGDAFGGCPPVASYFHAQGICCGCSGVFSEEAAAADPQPCSVREFPSAAACLISHPEPHFILFTADLNPDTGPLHPCFPHWILDLLCNKLSLVLVRQLLCQRILEYEVVVPYRGALVP